MFLIPFFIGRIKRKLKPNLNRYNYNSVEKALPHQAPARSPLERTGGEVELKINKTLCQKI